MRVITIPAWSDNYAYLLADTKRGVAAAVDPVDAAKVRQTAANNGLAITMVLTTHAHKDHDGGNADLARLADVTVVGGETEGVAACTRTVVHNDTLQLGDLTIQCLHTPYHTQGHMCFFCTAPTGVEPPVVFTGDALFVGGCGRNLGGDYAQMRASLHVLARLPPDTRVYCGHEYTQRNLEFLHGIDSENKMLAAKLEWARGQRANGMPTVPSTIAEELEYNAFLRCGLPDVQALVGEDDETRALQAWREAKDSYGPTAWLITKALGIFKLMGGQM